MTELEKLKKYLDDNGYESKYTHHRNLHLGDNKPDQVIVYNHGQRSWDAVCHDYSYGGDRGLLEIYGSICNDVIGWLTADDVIKILEYYAKQGPNWIPINSLDDIKDREERKKIELIDKDGKIWTFSNVISIDICFEKNWCNICYYDANNEYHEEVGDIPESIKFGVKEG